MSSRNDCEGRRGTVISILKDSDSLEIDQDALYSVLCHEDVGHKPISVISIVGPARSGKSFLLNYFLRYLENRGYESERINKIGDEDQALEGFLWGGGDEPQTKGIFMWSKPFILKKETKEIAVFLVDAQGAFDIASTKKKFSNVFMLTLLMSSFTIYNRLHYFQEIDLEYLEFCIGYSDMTRKNTGHSCRLQEIMFLMRDWRNPRDYKFGLEGGQKYLDKKILAVNPNEKNQPLHVSKRKLKKSFESFKCYLMPSPGEKAETVDDGYDFEGCTKDLTQKFKDHLIKLCDAVLNPSNLSVKHGMTGFTLFHFMIEASEILANEDECPPMESMLLAAINAKCAGALMKWMHEYQKQVEQELHDKFIQWDKFDKILIEKREKMKKKFLDDINIGEDEVQKQSDRFVKYISTTDVELRARNKKFWALERNKLAYISWGLRSEYEEEMAKHAKLHASKFEDEHMRCKNAVVQKLHSAAEEMKELEQDELDEVKELLLDGIDCSRRLKLFHDDYEKAKDEYSLCKALSESVDEYEKVIYELPEAEAMETAVCHFNECNLRRADFEEKKSELLDILHGGFSGERREDDPMMKALHGKYDKIVAKETEQKVVSERKLKEMHGMISNQALHIYESCKSEIPGTHTVTFEQWKSELESARRRHENLNKLREIRSYVGYFEMADEEFEEIKKQMKIGEDYNFGKKLTAKIEEQMTVHITNCENFAAEKYLIYEGEVRVPNFRAQIKELGQIWLKMEKVKMVLVDMQFQPAVKEIELKYLAAMKKQLTGSYTEPAVIDDLHAKLVKELLFETNDREVKAMQERGANFEIALKAHLTEIKAWNEGNSNLFRRVLKTAGAMFGSTTSVTPDISALVALPSEVSVLTAAAIVVTGVAGAGVLGGATVGIVAATAFAYSSSLKLPNFISRREKNVKKGKK